MERSLKTVSQKIALVFGSSMGMMHMIVAIAGTYFTFFLTDINRMSAAAMGKRVFGKSIKGNTL